METLRIAYDSREQKALHLLEGREISKGVILEYEEVTLNTFDYAIYGDWEDWEGHNTKLVHYAVERKSVGDFISSFCGPSAKNERAKIARAREEWGVRGEPIVYVIEGAYEEIKAYNYNVFPSGRINARVIMAKIRDLRWSGVHVILCPHRAAAEYEIISLLKKRARAVQFKKAIKAKAKGEKDEN